MEHCGNEGSCYLRGIITSVVRESTQDECVVTSLPLSNFCESITHPNALDACH